MKATELIKVFQENIETYGDLEVRNINGLPITFVEQCAEKDEKGKVTEWFEVV